ncbi:MAG: DUF3887 domain-containing protein [Phascolarctobacterium sp.]
MKKLLLCITALVALTACSLCFAADGNDLNKQQKTVEKFIDALDAAPAPDYAMIAPLLNEKFAQKLDAKAYAAFQKSAKEQLGTLKEAKFRLFERFVDGFRVVYVGSFDKEKVVLMQFVFDLKNALLAVNLNAVKEQQPAEAKAK